MKKNVAVVGYGGMGNWHAEHIQESDVAALAGVYDVKPERMEAAKSQGIPTYPSFEAVLEDKHVDIVVVATPNDLHKSLSVQSLQAGKNVICEKPVMLSVAELQEVIDVADANHCLFAVHQNRRWDSDYLAMKDVKNSGEIGEVLRLESRIHGSRGIPGDWRGWKRCGGGMLYDWGVHLIDQVMLYFDGPLKKVYCTVEHITNDEVDDGCYIYLIFESGCIAVIEVGTRNFISLPRFYAKGVDGTAIITDWQKPCKVSRCVKFDVGNVTPVKTAAGLTKTMAPRGEESIETYEKPIPKADVHDFYRNFCRSIDGLEQPLITHAQMIRVMKVIEACFRSAETGHVVAFKE